MTDAVGGGAVGDDDRVELGPRASRNGEVLR